MRTKKLLAFLLSLCMLLTMNLFVQADEGTTVPAAGNNAVTLTILHTNDTHARAKEGDGIGFAKISALIQQTRKENPNTLVLDAGDTFHGQTIATLNKGESIANIMNDIGFDAMTPGNHDFNYGAERLTELDGIANFPILAANVKKADGTDLLTPYMIKEIAGLKVGIFGLATPETIFKTHPDNVKGLTFTDPAKAAAEVTALLLDQTDMIICLSHLGMDTASTDTSTKVANEVKGIDLIIDGHSHTVLEQGQVVGDTLIVSTGEYDKNLGKVEVTVTDGKVTGMKAALISKDKVADVAADEAIVKTIEGIEAEQAVILDEVVGKTEVDLEGAREKVRKGETNLGNLITDAMVSLTGADCALTNGGGIRASIAAGDITKGDIIQVLPFGNYIITKNVPGADIKAALEHGTSAYPELLGGFPHVSGIQYVIDTGRPAGDRVVDITVNGAPLDLNAEYTLATNDFMAAGGDNYTMFADNKILNEYSGLDEAVITYVKAKGTIAPAMEGRITVKASPVSITVVHTNDTHARVKEGDGMGFAKISTIIQQLRQENPNVLVFDAGDTFHGQTIATLNKGESIANIMNAIGFDAMTPGNHDFNYGTARLVELDGITSFPILAANVKKEDGTDLFTPYVIKEIAGLKVGIFGLATPETTYKTHPDNVRGIVFMDPVKAAAEMTALLKDQTDIIICLAHLGMDAASTDTSIKIANSVGDIDLLIDGHSHTVLEQGLIVDNTLIVSTGEYGKNLGTVELTVAEGKITEKKAALISKEKVAEVVPDEAIVKAIEGIEAEQAVILNEVVGKTEVALEGAREKVRKGETNLGNLITDAMVSLTGADCALTNGGGIRASIAAGNITKGNIIEVLPFGNYIVTKVVTGADIKAALEHGTSAYPELLGGFPHVSCITYVIDTSKPAGNHVTDIKVKGKPLDLNGLYTLATNDFMAAGGDNYTMFADNAILNEYSGLDEAVITYVKAKGTIAPKAEGRITAKDGSVKEPQYYIVKKGDWLRKIAKMFNTTWQKLQELNQLKNPNLIYPNQKILLP